MHRNVESRFALNPSIDIGRSTFDRSSSVKLSFDVGELIPFYVDEVLPGDTFKISTSRVVRMQSLLTPIMDNIYLDTYYFFVPNRLVWEHWREFNGENTESAWVQQVEYSVPQVTAPATTGWEVGTLADYFGIPTGVAGLSVNALPFRAYGLIVNEWFRDENLVDPLVVPTGDATQTGTNGSDYKQDICNGGAPFVVAKYHDYFTSALPAPQKGPDVTLPVASGGTFPVYATEQLHSLADLPTYSDGTRVYMQMYGGDSSSVGNEYYTPYYPQGQADKYTSFDATPGPTTNTGNTYPAPVNLWAIDTNPQAATINQLRLAFQIQKLYERDARGGTRYIEILKSHFGVTSPDARLQRPEYLGGNRIPITISQVVQQSGTADGTTPQGTTTGMSLTTDTNDDFVRSFTEHGYIIGVMCARYDHTYQQGIERMWSRKTRFDYYWPVFANIGEQAILNKEIFAQGTAVDDEVFGYQEAWAEYRYKPNRVAGEMRSSYAQSLDVWHLADDYATLPSLSASWIQEDKAAVDRCLAVTSTVSNQLFADLYVRNICTRPMPANSIPGLIDHH